MAKPREKVPAVELSSAFQKKADLEYQRLRDTVARNLKEEMLGLLEDEIHSDLLISNGTVSVRAHKCIVQARSRHLWQESWLTQKPDPDGSADISCLEMPGLNGEQLMQFARQLYSVSDAALLLEEYINYMPTVKQSSSHLETGFDSITSNSIHQPDMEDHSNSCLLADNIGVGAEVEQEHVTDKRTSKYTDMDNRIKEQSDLSVTHCEAPDNDHDNNRKSIFRGQTVHIDSKIVSLPVVSAENQTVCTESRCTSSADIPVESHIVSLSETPRESKIVPLLGVHIEKKTARTESVVEVAESKIVSSDVSAQSKTVCIESNMVSKDNVPVESKIISLPEAHTERETGHTESKTAQAESNFISSSDVSTQSKISCTEIKIVSSGDILTESKIISLPDAHTEKETSHIECKTAQAESQDLSSPDILRKSKDLSYTDVHTESKDLLSPGVHRESKTTQAESKDDSSPDIHRESKTTQAESKDFSPPDVHRESMTTQAESKDFSPPDVHRESKTTQAVSKDFSPPDVHRESKTTEAESKDFSPPDVHRESKTTQAESKDFSPPDVHRESKTTQAESKDFSSPDVHRESKTTQAESKDFSPPDAHRESKTTQAESKDFSPPDVHRESKTTQAESKDFSSPDVHRESKTTQAESKDFSPPDAHRESKTTQAESKDFSSPDVHRESKTTQAESKDFSPPDVHRESKTTQAESKDFSPPDVHRESKTTQAESKDFSPPDVHRESKTTQAESKDFSSPDVHRESKTTQAESKDFSSPDVHRECKTTQAESKDFSSPDVHRESKTTQAESKDFSSPDVHRECKTTQAESKDFSSPDVHRESKTTQAESKDFSSPDIHRECKTTQAESKDFSSPDVHRESKTTSTESKALPSADVHTESKNMQTSKTQGLSSPDVHKESKTSPIINNTVSTESKAVVTESKAVVTESKAVVTESKAVVTESKAVVTESKAVVTESKAVVTESKAVVTESKAVVTESKAVVTESKAVVTESKAVVTESKNTQVEQSTPLSSQINNEDNQVPLPSPGYGDGTEPTDLRVHPEVVDSSLSSDIDLLKEQLVHEVISSCILGKDRLELLDFIELEARIVNSLCLADGASADSSLSENLVNSDVSENLQNSDGKRDDVVEDGYLQISGKILTETSEAVGHEKTSDCDLVISDDASEQYKPCSLLGRDLLSMYLHEENCDCCLSVDGVHFMAHKCILSARCEYFLAMFGGQWSESQMATVNLEAVSPQAVKQLLLFLYGGVINLCVPSNLKELFVIADMYGVLTFRTVLSFYVKKDLCHFFHKPCPACVTTTSEALVLCHNFHLEDLQARCLKWMAKYFTKIWPTKTFSMLEDSIHQLCFESILSEITASNVLDIIIECNKLISSLPRIKWTETVLYLVTRLMDSAIEYTSSHFVDVLKTKEFLLWAKVASWKASVLEEIFYSVINSLPVDAACLVFQTLIKLQELHSSPDNTDAEITALLESMIKCCEKFFRTHIHHVTRSKQWSVLPQQIQARILEISAYVYLPEPPGSMSSRTAAKKLHPGKHEPTLPIGITAVRSRPGASALTISAPARSGLTAKTSPHSGRRADKRHEARMSRSISESLPSRSKKTGASLKAAEIKVRASSRDRHRADSSVQAGSLGRNDNQTGFSSFDPKFMSARDESQGSALPNARHFGFQPYSHSSKPGAYFISKTETKKDEVRSHQDEVTEKGLETEGHGSSQQMSSSLKLTLSSQSKSGNGTKKLSPVGQKSHMISKLPTLIRSQRQPHRQQFVNSEVLEPECSSSTSTEIMPSECPSSTSNEVTAVDCPASRSNEVIPPEYTSSTDIESMLPECPSSTSIDMISSEKLPTSACVDLVRSDTADEGINSIKGTEDKASVIPTALSLDDAPSDLSMLPLEPAIFPNKDLPLNLSHNKADHPIQLTDSMKHLPNNLHTATMPDGPENSNSNSQEFSTSEAIATLDFSSYTSDAILSDSAGNGHMTAGLHTAEVQAEVKIVHMSKTLNVGFIVPPD